MDYSFGKTTIEVEKNFTKKDFVKELLIRITKKSEEIKKKEEKKDA